VADLWGADGTAQIAMPGDNGDWTNYDNFLQALFTAIKQNNMTPGLDFEIWNEPDLNNVFWQRDEAQYLQMWGHAYSRIRSGLSGVPIVGPCSSSQPSLSNNWYINYYPFIKSNNSVPNYYCWHEETSGDDIANSVAGHKALISKYGLPTKPIIINEYALPEEQVPGAAAWFISRLERYNVTGLRGNWASHYSLHDYLGNMLGKPDATEDCQDQSCVTSTGYWGNGEYNVYKYYYKNMTGSRVATTGSPDGLFDIYATRNGAAANTVKMLCGSRLSDNTWDILVTNLDAVGLPPSGTINIHSYQFNYGAGTFDNVHVVDQGVFPHQYTNNQLVFFVSPNQTTGYAFELVP